MTGSRTVVVVPVFNAAAETGRCLQVLAANLAPQREVVVIDDASTDPAIRDLLGQVSETWTLIHHRDNRGFVATANEGLALAGDADVVLLNSDTVPAGEWLDRIEACAASDPTIASITPFTNNGEIASIPEFCRPNPMPADPGLWARACLEAGPPEYPEIPTAVGFCMYLRRACLDRIGDFDEVAFGRGYGEENDWCLRAAAAGWRHVLCDDAFVAHRGSASFGPLGLKPDDESMRRLAERHPGYPGLIGDFIDRDPLRSRRERVIAAYRALESGPVRH